MTEAHPDRLTTPLLILRITIGLFLLQWGIEKLVIPETTAVIFSHFYKIDGVGENAAMVMGILQSLLALAILFGFQTPSQNAEAHWQVPFFEGLCMIESPWFPF